MKLRVCHIGMAAVGAVGALLAGCGLFTDEQASSTFETENSVALNVETVGGKVAARVQVRVRPDDYLAGVKEIDGLDQVYYKDSLQGFYNDTTDGEGQLNVPKLKPGNYVVEIDGDDVKASKSFTVTPTTCDSLSIKLDSTASVSGQVLLPAGVASATVGVRGLDYFVETDSLGNFEFESLPAGLIKAVGFNSYTTEYVDENGDVDVYDNFRSFGSASVKVDAGETKDSLTIGRKPVAEKDTLPYFIDNFDGSSEIVGWTKSNSRYTTAVMSSYEEGGKYGRVAHLDCHKDSIYNVWTMMGRDFAEFHDFSDLDSVVFWVRAEGAEDDSMWVSVSFETELRNAADSAVASESGKAWGHVGLTTRGEWTKIKMTPKKLAPADSNKIGGNVGWDAVKEHVNRVGIFAGRNKAGDYELFIDDFQIFGIRGLYE